MKKIAYYTEVNLSDNDGPATNELEFIRSLIFSNTKNYVLFLSEVNKNNPLLQNLDVHFLQKSPRFLNVREGFKRFYKMFQKIKKENIKFLVCRVPDQPFMLLFLKIFNPKVKIAIKTAALWWIGKDSPKNYKDKFYNAINNFITCRVYKSADVIDVAMLETKENLLRLGFARKEKIHLIDNAINTDMFIPSSAACARKRFNIPENAIVLGFAGFLPSQRGASQILKVVEALLPKIPNLYVLIVGNDEKLDVLIRSARVPKENIILPGKVPYADVPFYLSAMSICYSFFEPHKIQKTGNASQKVKQYVSMGKPVISVASGHSYLKDHDIGSPVDQDNIKEIIQETQKWIKRIEEEGEVLGQRLHQYAKNHFSTQKTFEQRMKIWTSLF